MNRFALLLALVAMLLSGAVGCEGKAAVTTVVRVSVRPSLLDSSTGVLQVRNISMTALSQIRLDFRNNDSNQAGAYVIASLGVNETREIGMLEAGWMFEPNETIDVSVANHTGVKYNTYRAGNGTIGIKQPWF